MAISQEKNPDFFSKADLLIIPYQPVKFQDNSSNSFLDILLARLKCQNFQRAITEEFFFVFFFQ